MVVFFEIGINYVKQGYFVIQNTFIWDDSKLSFLFHVINMSKLQKNTMKLIWVGVVSRV